MDFYLSFEALIGSLLALAALFYFFRSILLESVIYIPEKTRHSWKNLQILNRVSEFLILSLESEFLIIVSLLSCLLV